MKLKVGDKVLVRAWGELLRDENINTDRHGDLQKAGEDYSFSKRMKRYCGRAAVIREINSRDEIKLTFNEFGVVEFMFRDWMLEPKDI